ncbi:MAG: thioredoxin, partial [Dehalococcoidales bacterium]
MNRLYSAFVSSAQRLPNGNTLITEGNGGRIIEVTAEHEIVWEYVSPYKHRRLKFTLLYRAYRIPYAWAPLAEKPREIAIPRIDNTKFRVPGPPKLKRERVVRIKG